MILTYIVNTRILHYSPQTPIETRLNARRDVPAICAIICAKVLELLPASISVDKPDTYAPAIPLLGTR